MDIFGAVKSGKPGSKELIHSVVLFAHINTLLRRTPGPNDRKSV